MNFQIKAKTAFKSQNRVILIKNINKGAFICLQIQSLEAGEHK